MTVEFSMAFTIRPIPDIQIFGRRADRSVSTFPGKYVHIGGDEVPKDAWKNNSECQALMKQEGLKNQAELQSWFTRRIEKFVSAHGRTLIGWSEILQGGIAQNAVVMDWIGGATEAAKAGHDVVMSLHTMPI